MTALKTLTIRLSSDSEREALRYVMREAGIPFASRAVIFACRAYREQCERDKAGLADLRTRHARRLHEQQQAQQRRIRELTAEVRRLRQALQRISSVAADATGDGGGQDT